MQTLLSGRPALAPVPCRQNARFVVRAEGEDKKEDKKEEPKKESKAVAKVRTIPESGDNVACVLGFIEVKNTEEVLIMAQQLSSTNPHINQLYHVPVSMHCCTLFT